MKIKKKKGERMEGRIKRWAERKRIERMYLSEGIEFIPNK